MSTTLPESRARAIEGIHRAFAYCPRPQRELLSSWGGLDRGEVLEHWGKLDRAAVTRIDLFDGYLGEDLSSMSAPALRYFLPALFELILTNPKNVDFSGIMAVVGRLEGIAGLSKYHEGGFYLPITLTSEQRIAVREFCGQLMTIFKKFNPSLFEAEYRGRIKSLRKHILTFSCDADYDAELFAPPRRAPHVRRTSRHSKRPTSPAIDEE